MGIRNLYTTLEVVSTMPIRRRCHGLEIEHNQPVSLYPAFHVTVKEVVLNHDVFEGPKINFVRGL